MLAPRRKPIFVSDTTIAAKQVAVLFARPFHRSPERVLRLAAGFCFQFTLPKRRDCATEVVGKLTLEWRVAEPLVRACLKIADLAQGRRWTSRRWTSWLAAAISGKPESPNLRVEACVLRLSGML